MNPQEPGTHLMEFLKTLPGGDQSDALGQLDSLGLLQVITYLETTYGINLAKCHIEPDDLRSVTGLLGIVERWGR
jgi:acyl carrier protein